MKGCRASFLRSIIRYLLGYDDFLSVLVVRGIPMKPLGQDD